MFIKKSAKTERNNPAIGRNKRNIGKKAVFKYTWQKNIKLAEISMMTLTPQVPIVAIK